MSYFYARARERAAESYGGLLTAQGEKAAEAVDERRFRHAGPKPQTREAALIMLADGVEAGEPHRGETRRHGVLHRAHHLHVDAIANDRRRVRTSVSAARDFVECPM